MHGQALVMIESLLTGFTFLMFRRVFHELASTLCLSNLISSHISGALNQEAGSWQEGLKLKLKLQYLACLMQGADSLEKTLMLGKTEGRRRRGRQRT